MKKVYKSKVAKWYLWACIGSVAAFAGTLFLCYHSTWILLIDAAFMGITVALMFDMLFHTDYTIKEVVPHDIADKQNKRNNP